MQTDRWIEVEELFDRAVAMPAGKRSRFLQEACGDDAKLLTEVESLLEADRRSARFLERPAADAAEGALEDSHAHGPLEGETIGRFRLVRRIAAGGMGVVYEATQDEPKRKVAVKVLRTGVTSRAALRRFRDEAQTLARLQHPGIAQVLEAGTFDRGAGATPYFAMECVEGVRLDALTRDAAIGIRSRIDLLARICDAVHHAHQKGVIHRDLKPSNIIVNDASQPKILDFGVARLTDSDVQATLRTEVGQIIGTLPYMSPEQVEGDPVALDTRSDVYALGVIGYELLGGALPLEVSTTSIAEAARRIRDDAPSPLGSLNRQCAGDIEIIIGKAMEKEPARRYESAAALAEDLRRSLRNEPILARPPGTWYQLQKFARRNKALVASAAAVLVMLIAAVVVSTAFAVSANRAWHNEHIAKQDAVDAQAVVEERADELSDVNAFLRYELLEAAFPWRDGDEVTVVERIDMIAEQLESRFADQPPTYAGLAHSIGNVYQEIGRHKEAETLLRRAIELWQHADSRKSLGDNVATQKAIYSSLWLAKLLRVENRLDEAIATARHAHAFAGELTEQRDVHQGLANFGIAAGLMQAQRYLEAEHALRESLRLRNKAHGPSAIETRLSVAGLMSVLLAMNRIDEAVEVCRTSLDEQGLSTRRGLTEPIAYLYEAAFLIRSTIDYEWIELAWREILAQTALHHDQQEYLTTAALLHRLGDVLRMQQRYTEAAAAYREALDLRIERLGNADDYTGWSMLWLGRTHVLQEEYDLAVPLLEDAVKLFENMHGRQHPTTRRATRDLENARIELGSNPRS